MQPADLHEFELLNDGETAILTSYQVLAYDLSAFNITTGLGWILECVFQEVNVTSGDVLFEWFSMDHVDISATQTTPNETTDSRRRHLTTSTSTLLIKHHLVITLFLAATRPLSTMSMVPTDR